MDKEEKTPYQEGKCAGFDRIVTIDSNPYRKGTKSHDDWANGWEDGDYEIDQIEQDEDEEEGDPMDWT